VTALSTGQASACALLSGGTVECWGDNTDGQLGNGTTTNSLTPVAVSGLSGVTAISAGWNSACALLSSGTVECWGDNTDGQLGNGTTTGTCPDGDPCSPTPVAVSGLSGVTAISAGNSFVCALLSGGSVQCWGDNNYGELGNGSSMGPDTCTSGSGSDPCSTAPVAVSGLSGVTAISSGGGFACALLSSGTIQCWGTASLYGALGDGSRSNSPSTPGTVSGLSGVTAISAGGQTFACALLGGSVQCWGENLYGALGSGTTVGSSSTPVAVSGLSDVTAISAGWNSACALLSGGTVQCWGYNANGQLGNGTTSTSPTPSATPVPVAGLSAATAISLGYYFACALLSGGGTVQCWGENVDGELGNGTTSSSSSTPVAVVW